MNKINVYNEYNNLSENIKEYRKMRNLTQEQLAEKALCSTSYIKQIESQKNFKNVTFITITNICNALGIDTVDLFKKNK